MPIRILAFHWSPAAWLRKVATQAEMGKNRFAAGIVMVPCLLLSAAFFSTAVWGDVPGENQSLALGLGGLLLAAGLLALLIPSTNPETNEDETDPSP